MDRARRGGRTPGIRGSRLVTEGCSAAFEGGELAKRPKGCEPFASGQSARGCTLAGAVERRSRQPEQTRFGGASHGALPTAHTVQGNLDEVPAIGKRLGTLRPRKGHGISRRTRRRSRGCARTLYVSLQKSIGGFGPEKPFPRTYFPEREMRDAVDGGLAYGCNQSCKVASAVTGGAHLSARSSSLRSYAWRREP